MPPLFKPVLTVSALALLSAFGLWGCSTNPATGQSQFAALMSPQQEASVGAQEHTKIMQQYGGVVKDKAITDYVTRVGQRVATNTERADVQYKFFVLDTQVVNAFALPGGYVYVTRGILALANSEAQLASVLAHEVGHVTARHSAERYSHGVVTSLGAAILSAALDSNSASQAANLGSQLYLSSYSRKQESQADELGIRYLDHNGYDPRAMAEFLNNLARYTAFEAQEAGRDNVSAGYFSTHPQTEDRAAQATAIAASTSGTSKDTNRDTYLKTIDSLTFGDSADQGFVRGQRFWHPQMNFTFAVPDGYELANNPAQIVAKDKASGAVVLFDSAPNPGGQSAADYLTQSWMKGEAVSNLETIDINGKRAATGEFKGLINKQPVTVRLTAVEWAPGTFFRFQMAIPQGVSGTVMDGLKRVTYSLRPMTASEIQSIKPYRLQIVTAKPGDSVTSIARNQPYPTLQEERFRALNGMNAAENVTPGVLYKNIVK